MKIIALAGIAVVTVALSGCPGDMRMSRSPDPHAPNITVASGGYIVVDQEPIVVPKSEKDFVIVWQLPRDSVYTFPEDGIVVARGDDEFKCNLEGGRQRFTCRFRNSKPGIYKYTIKVMESTKLLEPLDPHIANG